MLNRLSRVMVAVRAVIWSRAVLAARLGQVTARYRRLRRESRQRRRELERLTDRLRNLEDDLRDADRRAREFEAERDVHRDQLELMVAWQDKWLQRQRAEAALYTAREALAPLMAADRTDQDLADEE